MEIDNRIYSFSKEFDIIISRSTNDNNVRNKKDVYIQNLWFILAFSHKHNKFGHRNSVYFYACNKHIQHNV